MTETGENVVDESTFRDLLANRLGVDSSDRLDADAGTASGEKIARSRACELLYGALTS
jgi:hypothetical protein